MNSEAKELIQKGDSLQFGEDIEEANWLQYV